MKKTLLATGAAAVLLLTGACGGGDDRPTKEDFVKIATEENDGKLSGEEKKAVECYADLVVESDLSDEGLNAIVDQDEDYKPSKEDEKVLTDVITKAAEDCGGLE